MEHFIKLDYKILKIKNQGKAFLQSNSAAKKANVFRGQIQNCFMAGMNDFIAKPVNVRTLKLKMP